MTITHLNLECICTCNGKERSINRSYMYSPYSTELILLVGFLSSILSASPSISHTLFLQTISLFFVELRRVLFSWLRMLYHISTTSQGYTPTCKRGPFSSLGLMFLLEMLWKGFYHFRRVSPSAIFGSPSHFYYTQLKEKIMGKIQSLSNKTLSYGRRLQ